MPFDFERWKPPANAPLIVGEQNPYGADPRFAMFPMPERSAGGRLCSLILGMQTSKYLLLFNRANLCDGPWSMPKARIRARQLWEDPATRPPGKLILLGSKVCKAFETAFTPFEIIEGGSILILPHPSGLNRLWNEPGIIERARAAVVDIYPEVLPFVGLE